jgi:hypothetical protein
LVQPTPTFHSHSFKPFTPTDHKSPTHQLPSSSPSKHSHITGNTRYSDYKGRNTFEQIETKGNHINDIEDNINNIVDEINKNIITVNWLENAINNMTTILAKLAPNDDDNQTSTSKVMPKPHSQCHSHKLNVNVSSKKELDTLSPDKDLSFEPESLSGNKNVLSYKAVLNSKPAHTSKSTLLLPINTVSNNPVLHTEMTNPLHNNKMNLSHPQFYKTQPHAFQPFQAPSSQKLPTMSPTKFNSNQFFYILETNKLKYPSMETYLLK